MTSQENGFATATLELWSGYPAYFYNPGDGEYIFAVDKKYGLPMRLGGDAGPDVDWICGFNQGVIAYIEQYGLPWNSRRSSLNILSDLSRYFRHEAARSTRLKLKGKPFQPDGVGFTLNLGNGSMGVSVELEAKSLFKNPSIVPGAMRAYRHGPPPASAPIAARRPPLQSGTEFVWLRFWDDAQCVECVPAPVDSHLVVFRFSDFAPSSWRRTEAKEDFAALDTQLADWIPGALSEPWSQ